MDSALFLFLLMLPDSSHCWRNIAITLIEGSPALSGVNECNRLFASTIDVRRGFDATDQWVRISRIT